MSRAEWIVCERSGHWAAAVRVALDRSGWPPGSVPRVFEVRRLDELAARLATRPDASALVEVQRASVSDVLEWFAAAGRACRRTTLVALVERSVWESLESDLAEVRRGRQSVVDALYEAGAAEVVTSPRQLHGVLALGRRHASLREVDTDAMATQRSIADRAWASLPWQGE